MDTYARKLLYFLIYLGTLMDITNAVTCLYRINTKIHEKYCSERCCYHGNNMENVTCCSYSHKDMKGIYLWMIIAAVVIVLNVLWCVCKHNKRGSASRRTSFANYGSSDYHVPLQTDESLSPRQPNRFNQPNHISEEESLHVEIQSPPPYDSIPPAYSRDCPENERHHNQSIYPDRPPPPYSASSQSQSSSDRVTT